MNNLARATFLLLLGHFFLRCQVSADVAAFLERQRQLAEEQWNSNDEGLKYEDDDEDDESGDGSATESASEYQYVYVDENGEYYQVDEEEDEEEAAPVFIPKKKKSKGYKKYAGRSLRKFDPYFIEDMILEMHQLTKCPIRNESSMMKLKDDHQLNLRMIKKEAQERRRGLEPTPQVYCISHPALCCRVRLFCAALS